MPKEPPDDSRLPEIRLMGVSMKTHSDIKNIAKNVGVPMNDFIKTKLGEIACSYPDHMRLPPKKD